MKSKQVNKDDSNGVSNIVNTLTTPNSNDTTTNKHPKCTTHETKTWYLKPTTVLPILVALDYFSVALVVPLLHQYYKNAGVSSASQRELLSSIFNGSQIIGGILVGALSDVGVLSPRQILFISFLGSALAYSLIMLGDFRAMVFSRILVGLVKQTMTVTTSILAKFTTKHNRAHYMGRLQASSSIGFIIGTSVGGYLYKHGGEKAPACLATCVFVINFLLAAIFIPVGSITETTVTNKHQDLNNGCDHRDKNGVSNNAKNKKTSRWANYASFTTNLQSCFSSKALGSLITCLLVYHWVMGSTSYANLPHYYEELFGIETHQRGYLTSYENSLSFIFQAFFVQASLQALGGEYNAACTAAAAMALANGMQIQAPLFLSIGLPMTSISVAILNVSLMSLITQVAPKHSLASVLAALDVLKNMASVTVPFYRTFLFRMLGRSISGDGQDGHGGGSTTMVGDISPLLWVKSSVFHWLLVTILLTYILPRFYDRNPDESRQDDEGDDPKKKR